MTFPNNNQNQRATYWPPGTPDGFGGLTFLASSTLNVRWEVRTELFIDPQGNEETASDVIYAGVDVLKKGWLFNGVSASTDPTTVAGAKEIRDFKKSPTLAGDVFLRKILL